MGYVKRISILLIIASVLGIIAGCGIVQVNPEKDRALVVAEVNGEKILKGELLDRLDREKAYYNLTDEAIKDKNNKEQVLEVKKVILDQIATEKLLSQKATEAGFVVTDELRAEAKKELDDIKANIKEELEAADKAAENEEKEETEEKEDRDYAKEAEDYIASQLEAMGKTEDEYIEFIAEQKCIEKLFEKTVEGMQVSDQDIEKYYNEELATQKENSAYMGNSSVVLFEPERVRVKHISIDIPDEKASEYQTLVKEKKDDEAKALLDKELEAIKGKAEEVLGKVKADEDFVELVKEYNPGNEELMKEGMTINKGSLYLPEAYLEAAFKLGEGEISDLVATPYGYYIIKLEEKYPEKTYTLEEKKDDIKEVLVANKENEKWKEVVEDWKDKSIKRFEKRL